MNTRLLFAILVLLVPFSEAHDNTESGLDEKHKADLIAQGATPEDMALFEEIYSTSRPTLVCLCHHEKNVTTCGVDGHLYLNECSARCRHVEVACVGETCGDCAQYGPQDLNKASAAAPSKEAPKKSDELEESTPQPKGGRRFLSL